MSGGHYNYKFFIEDYLPIRHISAEVAREKSIAHEHTSVR